MKSGGQRVGIRVALRGGTAQPFWVGAPLQQYSTMGTPVEKGLNTLPGSRFSATFKLKTAAWLSSVFWKCIITEASRLATSGEVLASTTGVGKGRHTFCISSVPLPHCSPLPNEEKAKPGPDVLSVGLRTHAMLFSRAIFQSISAALHVRCTDGQA